MNALTREIAQPVVLGFCQGEVGAVPFNANLVELSEVDYPNYPAPHDKAHVMLATQLAPEPDYTTKELQISFTKDLNGGTYPVGEATYPVGVTFIDRSIPETPVIYKQHNGIARIEYNPTSASLSGEISADLENRDDGTITSLNLRVIFNAYAPVRIRRNLRRPLPRTKNC
ncbi:hypothetical protein M3M50_12765 [Pseudomonas bijieensis]|uniref:hypothetical protein n=1 Tax=Pseudomonas bijieensis TaxID=2681983 RepID=UPI001E381F39|nr:hypothetical protein [Pseudomonas bijieensis]MCD9114624.1 hypothetical protein [Pseudomonas bijieensis]UQI33458.1 hypothetical protein M3M50_12765 [Pseudomonas bijieensis]